jgi:hypothetical protein
MFPLPQNRGALTAKDVIETAPGPKREGAINQWCAAVWNEYRDSHQLVEELIPNAEILKTKI